MAKVRRRNVLLHNLAMDALYEVRGRPVETIQEAEIVADDIVKAWLNKYSILHIKNILLIDDSSNNIIR